MRIKWYCTATIMIELNGVALLFDPFIPLNKKLLAPPVDELAAAESIFITHGHLDHLMGVPTVLASGGGQTVYCTGAPKYTLSQRGVDDGAIQEVAPGDIIDVAPFEIRVLKGRHIVFDKWLVVKTVARSIPSLILRFNAIKRLLNENKVYSEAGETVVYEISASGKRVLLLGSMNLDDSADYPTGADLLVIPLQGRSDISSYALSFVGRLLPRKVLLDHYDDTFPPVSSAVKTGRFISLMREMHPDIPVLLPCPGAGWTDV